MNDNINFKEIPLSALSERAVEFLSASLNAKKILSNQDISRDWRGLTSFLLLSRNDFDIIDQSKNPFRKLLGIWKDSYADANFSKLIQSLQVIQRFDVHDDVIELLAIDARNFLEDKNVIANVQEPPSLIPEALLLPESAKVETVPSPQPSVYNPTIKSEPDNHIITKQDYLHQQPQLYDVFVLYDEEDSTHMISIQEIVKRLEKINFSLCIKERDFLMGVEMEHDAVLNMIANRCERVVIFVSRKFLLSRYNQFLSQFCQRQSIDKGRRKLIPILMEDVNLPLSLKYSNPFKFYKQNPFANFYDILETSLRVPQQHRST